MSSNSTASLLAYLRPGNTRVGDEDVEATVELLGDVINDSLGVLEVSDVRLIRTA